MRRYAHIQELLDETSDLIGRIESTYAAALTDEEIKGVSRPAIKSSLEHLRSSLEYCAQDINDIKIGNRKRLYFPYGDTLQKFQGSVSTYLPNLQRRAPKIYQLIHDLQPFACQSNWLIQLCLATNQNKHDQLSTQTRKNSAQSTTNVGRFFKIEDGGSFTVENCTFNGVPVGQNAPVVIGSQRTVKDIQSDFPASIVVDRTFAHVQFVLLGPNVDALKLIKAAHTNISQFVAKLNAEIP